MMMILTQRSSKTRSIIVILTLMKFHQSKKERIH
jgi:hypothetical protein